MKKRYTLLFLFAVVIMAACGTKKPEPVSFQIEMTEYAFSPNTLELKVGQEVTLEFVNLGQLKHEIMFGKDVMRTNQRPSGYMVDMFTTGKVEPEIIAASEGAGEGEEEGHGGFMAVLPKNGDRVTIRFLVTPAMVGTWEMGCFEQDGVHYDAGMHGTVVVSK